MAIPAMDDLELRLQGEAKGWLDATCTYYGLGWLTPDQGRKALKRLMLLLTAHYLDPEETERAKSAALSRDPQCKTIWPSHLNDVRSGSVQLYAHLYGDGVVDLWTTQFVVDRLAV